MSYASCLSKRGDKLLKSELCFEQDFKTRCQNNFNAKTNPEGIINLGVSENKLMFDVLKTKFQESASNDIKEEHTHYCDFGGLPEFKKEIADLYDYFMKPVEPVHPSNLLVLNGCAAVVEALCTVLTDPGEGILIPSPYYGGFDADLKQRAEAVPFPVYLSSKPGPGETKPFELTVFQLEEAMKDAKEQGVTIRCLLLTNPNNPLGNIYSEKQLQDYLDFAHRHSLHVLLDEIYTLSIFKKGFSMKSILSFTKIPDRQRLHVIWGFSKDFGISGFRCGVLHTWNDELRHALKWVAYFQSVPTSTQCLLMNLIKDKEWIEHVFMPTNHQRLLECHGIVCDRLKKASIPYVESCAGLFVWADFREIVSSQTFEEELSVYETLVEHKVNINPGQSFFFNEPGWFRIVFATDPHELRLGMERLLSCVDHIREEVDNKKRKLKQAEISYHDDELKIPSSENDVTQEDDACAIESTSLEDLARSLRCHIRNSNWLEINTAEKWTKENPELAKAFLDNIHEKHP